MTTLASASPARARLLRSAGVEFDIAPPRIDEEGVKASLLARGKTSNVVAVGLAMAKAQDVSRSRADIVIGADQTLDLDGETLSKARSLAEARDSLLRLRGRTHRLHSAAAIARDGKVRWRHVATVSLTMRPFSDPFLDAYLSQCGEAIFGCLGCYEFEGPGAQLFERVIGDHHAILGLPLIRLLAALRAEGTLPQ